MPTKNDQAVKVCMASAIKAHLTAKAEGTITTEPNQVTEAIAMTITAQGAHRDHLADAEAPHHIRPCTAKTIYT